jgi:hypothetical protein
MFSQICRRAATCGATNCNRVVTRRPKASSMFSGKFVVRMAMPEKRSIRCSR